MPLQQSIYFSLLLHKMTYFFILSFERFYLVSEILCSVCRNYFDLVLRAFDICFIVRGRELDVDLRTLAGGLLRISMGHFRCFLLAEVTSIPALACSKRASKSDVAELSIDKRELLGLITGSWSALGVPESAIPKSRNQLNGMRWVLDYRADPIDESWYIFT